MDYKTKKLNRQIRNIEHEIEYYIKVYKKCEKLNQLTEKLKSLKIKENYKNS